MPWVGYYDGKFVDAGTTPVAIEERGHQFGDGVYEVVRVYGGRPFLLDWHLDRMDNSLKAVEIENPLDRAGWVHLIGEAIRRSEEPESLVYWQVTRGTAPRNHVFPQVGSVLSLTVRPLPAPAEAAPAAEPSTDDMSQSKLPLLLALPDERWVNAWVKSINLLPNVIAKELAHRFDAQEAMLVRNGQITECSGSNVWFVKGGELYTAPTNRYILPGITRKFVYELANEAGVKVHEEAVNLSDLKDVDEIFVTSTTQEIQSIGRVMVPVDKEAALYSLPEERPISLVETSQDLKPLWVASSAPEVGLKLSHLFTQYVHRIREGEVTLALGN